MRLESCNAYNVCDFLTLLTLAYYYERAFDEAAELAERTLARYPKNPNVPSVPGGIVRATGSLGGSARCFATCDDGFSSFV